MTTLVALVALTAGQCPGGVCRPNATVVAPEVEWAWVALPADNQYALLWRGRQVGCWRVEDGKYVPRLGAGVWGEPVDDAPVLPPTPRQPAAKGVIGQEPPVPDPENQGLDVDKIKGYGKAFTANGKQISRFEALAAVGATIPDDSKAQRVTVVAAKYEDAKAVADAVAKADHTVLVQAYAADDVMAKARGLAEGAYLQDGTGKLLKRWRIIPKPDDIVDAIKGKLTPDWLKKLQEGGYAWVAALALLVMGVFGWKSSAVRR